MDGIWKKEIIFLWTYENFRKLCANWLNFSQVFTNLGKLLKNLKFSMLKRSQKFAKFAKIFRILEKFHKFVRKLEKNLIIGEKTCKYWGILQIFLCKSGPVRNRKLSGPDPGPDIKGHVWKIRSGLRIRTRFRIRSPARSRPSSQANCRIGT